MSINYAEYPEPTLSVLTIFRGTDPNDPHSAKASLTVRLPGGTRTIKIWIPGSGFRCLILLKKAMDRDEKRGEADPGWVDKDDLREGYSKMLGHAEPITRSAIRGNIYKLILKVNRAIEKAAPDIRLRNIVLRERLVGYQLGWPGLEIRGI